ncbi:hypothetical protein [Archangium sp.]|uniref:hypothetical protein n=1 Tax=Archangium sp. TaxID=1872627 RepID=UPI003899DCFB
MYSASAEGGHRQPPWCQGSGTTLLPTRPPDHQTGTFPTGAILDSLATVYEHQQVQARTQALWRKELEERLARLEKKD